MPKQENVEKIIERILSWLANTMIHPAFGIIVGLVLVVLTAVQIIDLTIAISVAVAWFVAFIWIAHAEWIKRFPLLQRLLVLLVIALILALSAYLFGNWSLKKYRQQQTKAIQQPKQPSAEEIAKEVAKRIPKTEGITQQKEYKQQIKEKRFSVSLKNGIFMDPIAYKAANNKIYFVDYFLCIDLVNKTGGFSKIVDYYAQVLFDDIWISLQNILYYDQGQFYRMFDSTNRTGARIEFNEKTFEEQISRKNLAPGETITGILLFYLKDRNKYASVTAKKIKLILFDSLGNREEHLIDINNTKRKKEDANLGWVGAFGYTIKETRIDFKKFNIVNNY